MLDLLEGRAGSRKFRLFAVACCRRISHLLSGLLGQRAAEVAERYADGLATDAELAFARQSSSYYRTASSYRPGDPAAHAACAERADYAANGAGYEARLAAGDSVARQDERVAHCSLIRDIFGNPFRPVSFVPAWLTPTVLKLAQAAYDNRLLPSGLLDNTRLAVLADALEEAGCDNQDILSHLRGPGPHVRGCWAVDLLLGKK
jgi:hypothetical protein